MGLFSFKKPKKSSVRQSYWGSSKVPKVPVWKQKNDDDRLGEKFVKERFPREEDEGYKNEWRERFKKGTAEDHMDSESTKVWKRLKKEEMSGE